MEKPKKKKARNAVLRVNKTMCRHDYKNAIQIGNQTVSQFKLCRV